MSTHRLQVPLETELYEQLEKRAKALGFDGIAPYLKVLAKADAEQRPIHFDDPILEETSRMALRVMETYLYEHRVAALSDETEHFKYLDDALKYVSDRIRRKASIEALTAMEVDEDEAS